MYVDSPDALLLRDTVLAIVAHDIRSPLATITIAASLLEDPSLDASQRTHFLAMIGHASAQIDRLIRDLLNIASIEGGQLALDRLPTSMPELLTEMFEVHLPQVNSRGVTLRLELPAVDSIVNVDRDRIIEVLDNLLTNALKFTPEKGTITLQCSSSLDDITITVADTGVGIPADQMGHIFERFWQAQHARRAGAGLGLAICKGIVEAHGGSIHVESEAGVGSTFYVVLPAA